MGRPEREETWFIEDVDDAKVLKVKGTISGRESRSLDGYEWARQEARKVTIFMDS